MSRPTLKDIATASGVSRMTASVVVNGARSGTRVSAETRERILQSAKKLGYSSNAIARSLHSRRTNIIGLYDTAGRIDPSSPFGAQLIHGLQQGCDNHRQDLLVHGTFPGRTNDEIYDELASGKIDGLVLIAPPDHPLVQRLSKSRFPVIAAVESVPDLPSVVVDDYGGSARLAELLVSKGHRRILYRRSYRDTASRDRRLDGFRDAVLAAGVDLAVCRPEGETEWLSAEELALLALPASERPTAVACWSDWFARTVVRYAKTNGLRIPDDLALMGFDGFYPYYEPTYHLTTVYAPWAAVGETAISYVMRKLDGEDVPWETVIPVDIQIGDTV